MDCNIVGDLLPLYIDGCCSEESAKAVEEHIKNCDACKKLLEDMRLSSDVITVSDTPKTFRKVNDWKASVLQSALLFVSFGLITAGVALEAGTPAGLLNGFWAMNLVIPATGFMLSLANWYFVRLYKSRKSFSVCSCITTLGITLCAYGWSCFHYEIGPEFLSWLLRINGMGILLTIAFCALSRILSNRYAAMLGKE
jgi:hypothetical protein